MCWENFIKDQGNFSFIIIWLIIITISLDNVWIPLGENWSWSPWGLKGLKIGKMPSLYRICQKLTKMLLHKIAEFYRFFDVNNLIAEHHLKTKHQIDWDSATCIMYSTDYYQRLTLESWFTNLEQMPLNHSQQLPVPYQWLVDKIKQN